MILIRDQINLLTMIHDNCHLLFHLVINFESLYSVISLPFLGYSLCLLNLGINPNKILRLGKNLQNWGKDRSFLDWEAACKIGKIKSLILQTIWTQIRMFQ